MKYSVLARRFVLSRLRVRFVLFLMNLPPCLTPVDAERYLTPFASSIAKRE